MPITEAERQRRRTLLHAHYAVENRNDLEGIIGTFAADAELLYNRQSFRDDGIRLAHVYIGLAGSGGAFSEARNLIDAEHFTDDEIVVEGRLCGRHVGEFQGFPPTDRDVALPFVAFYRFDAKGELVSERVVMNLATLGAMPGVVPGTASSHG